MIYAIDNNDLRVIATPNQQGICPICRQKLITKCGIVKVWHFAHKSNIECDSFAEHESQWHIDWKNRFDKSMQEIIIEKDGVKHIADLYVDGLVIELQHSSISVEDMIARELFYDNMIWIFDLKEKFNKGQLNYKPRPFRYLGQEQHLVFWNMKWQNTTYDFITKPLFFDIGIGLIQVKDKAIDGNGYFRGYSYLVGNIKYYANRHP